MFLLSLSISWASVDFFAGEGKIFQGVWAKIYYLLKKHQKDTIFLKKVKKNSIFDRTRAERGWNKNPPYSM